MVSNDDQRVTMSKNVDKCCVAYHSNRNYVVQHGFPFKLFYFHFGRGHCGQHEQLSQSITINTILKIVLLNAFIVVSHCIPNSDTQSFATQSACQVDFKRKIVFSFQKFTENKCNSQVSALKTKSSI